MTKWTNSACFTLPWLAVSRVDVGDVRRQTRNSESSQSVSCWYVQLFCDPVDCSPPGSSAHGILQAGILEWVIIPSSRGLPDLGIETGSSALQADSLPSEPPGKHPVKIYPNSADQWSLLLAPGTSFTGDNSPRARGGGRMAPGQVSALHLLCPLFPT